MKRPPRGVFIDLQAGHRLTLADYGRHYTIHEPEGFDNIRLVEAIDASRDPIFGAIDNPLTLNRFAYALANPATLTDPSGLSSTTGDAPPASTGCAFRTTDYPRVSHW